VVVLAAEHKLLHNADDFINNGGQQEGKTALSQVDKFSKPTKTDNHGCPVGVPSLWPMPLVFPGRLYMRSYTAFHLSFLSNIFGNSNQRLGW